MLRILVMTAVLLVGASPLEALDISSAGVSGGVSWMTQSLEYEEGLDLDPVDEGLVEPALGVFLVTSLSEQAALGFEAVYLRKGFKSEPVRTDPGSSDPTGTVTSTYRAHYLSLPLTFRFLIPAGSARIFPLAGVSGEFLLDEDDEINLEGMQDLSIALHLGAGVELGSFVVTARYLRDLSNSYDPPAGAALDRVTNQGVLVMLSYSFVSRKGE